MESQSHLATSTYELMRDFADSWFLLFMFLFFLGVVAFTLRPGSRALHRDIADIPFRGETPAPDNDDRADDSDDQRSADNGRA